MAKITNYDYNRTENSLTVTYESGTVRKYSVDCTPKSTQTFIMTDIINNILSEYKQKFLDRKAEIFPRIRYDYECHQFDPELSLENSNLCSNLNYISEFSSLSLVSFVSTLSRYYLALKDDALSKELPEYCSPYQHERLKSDYNFLSELVERFRIPADDCSFVFTLEHLLSVAFPDREYDAPETEDTTPEQSNNTPATENATPEVPAPVEKTEKPDDVPETASIEETEHLYNEIDTFEIPFCMQMRDICGKCKRLGICFHEYHFRIFECVHQNKPCDNDIFGAEFWCGETCTRCCSRFESIEDKPPELELSDEELKVLLNDELPF